MIPSNTHLPSGDARPLFRPCDIRPLLHDIYNAHLHQAHSCGSVLTIDIDNEVFERYEIAEERLTEILSHLINNAIDHTKRGIIKLDVKYISGDDVNDVLRFMVTDTGVGITAEQFKILSESFSVSADNNDNDILSGLNVVKHLLTQLNSELIFYSVENQGAEFSFDLLLKRSAQIKRSQTLEPGNIAVKNVLLAEDNLINALVARSLLSKWGIVADHAKDGNEAIAMAAQKVYDVILMDIHMPDVNGFQATKAIRTTDNLNAKTRIYALTADVTAKDQAEYAHFFDGFLNKPVEVDKLHKAITTGEV